MKRRNAGHAYVLMIVAVAVILAIVLGASVFGPTAHGFGGITGFGMATGDYIRRQVTADAAVRSVASVFAERLRHIGRLQEKGMDELEKMSREERMRDVEVQLGDAAAANGEEEAAERHYRKAEQHEKKARKHEETAKACARAAWAIAQGTPAAVEKEAREVTGSNGGRLEARPQGLDGWFTRVSSGHRGIDWVALTQDPERRRFSLAVFHTDSNGATRRADSTSKVESNSRPRPRRPITQDDWFGRLAPPI